MAQYELFKIDKGSDVAIQLHLEDEDGNQKNLDGYSIAAKMKKNFNSDSSDTHTFTAAINAPTSDGLVTLSLTNTQTDALKVGNYVYDVELSFVDDSGGDTIIERILEGKIRVSPSVT